MAGTPRPDEPPKALPPGIEHGTFTAYDVHKCHCGPCRDWRRGVTERTRARERGDLPAYQPSGRTHGTISCYNSGCHCTECRAAATAARRRRPSRLHTGLPCECPGCPATFATERGLRAHVGRIHDGAGVRR